MKSKAQQALKNEGIMGFGIATSTLDYFKTCLKNPKEDQVDFAVSVLVDMEKLLLEDIDFDTEGNVFGTVVNESTKYGSKIGISTDRIFDWMIIDINDQCIGGFTSQHESFKSKYKNYRTVCLQTNLDKSVKILRDTF